MASADVAIVVVFLFVELASNITHRFSWSVTVMGPIARDVFVFVMVLVARVAKTGIGMVCITDTRLCRRYDFVSTVVACRFQGMGFCVCELESSLMCRLTCVTQPAHMGHVCCFFVARRWFYLRVRYIFDGTDLGLDVNLVGNQDVDRFRLKVTFGSSS